MRAKSVAAGKKNMWVVETPLTSQFEFIGIILEAGDPEIKLLGIAWSTVHLEGVLQV